MGQNKIKVTGFRIFNENILFKLDIIAKRNMRNRNQEVNYILNKYVETYEAEHGEIMLPTENDDLQGSKTDQS